MFLSEKHCMWKCQHAPGVRAMLGVFEVHQNPCVTGVEEAKEKEGNEREMFALTSLFLFFYFLWIQFDDTFF